MVLDPAVTSTEVHRCLTRIREELAAGGFEVETLDPGPRTDPVSIADAMRHGKLDRIERQGTTNFRDLSAYARNTHSAIFAEVKVDEELGVIRVSRVVGGSRT